jgi:hypothetical protein
LRREEAGYDRIEFHSSKRVVAERHISTPWAILMVCAEANVEECGHGGDHHLLWF